MWKNVGEEGGGCRELCMRVRGWGWGDQEREDRMSDGEKLVTEKAQFSNLDSRNRRQSAAKQYTLP